MAQIFLTSSAAPPSSETQKLHVYNGMDCCVTLEVLGAIKPQLDEITSRVYDRARLLQAPILEMELRGVLVDKSKIQTVIARLERDQRAILEGLNELCTEGLGVAPINPGSWQQVQRLLYGDMGLPPVRKKGAITSDRKALEKLKGYFYAEPVINHILTYRDLGKQLGVLRTGIDPDGCIRTSFNVAGTDTGRFSSYESATGSGTNLQNITERLREVFVARPGKKFAYVDYEQIEARMVGGITWNLGFGSRYLDFCESGDLHTNTCRMTFVDLPWTDDPKANREIADRHFYRVDSYRQATKKLGHATNYFGQAPEVSRQTLIPLELTKNFQSAYFSTFPEIREWHNWTRSKLIKDGWITSLMGRRRWFFGRRYDNDTLKQAIAYNPQGSAGDYMSEGILALHRAKYDRGLPVDMLIQVHDALLVEYDEEREDELLPEVLRLLAVEVPLMNGRSLIVPTEAKVGWNWRGTHDELGTLVNPDGLTKYKGHDARTRTADVPLLERKFY